MEIRLYITLYTAVHSLLLHAYFILELYGGFIVYCIVLHSYNAVHSLISRLNIYSGTLNSYSGYHHVLYSCT
jgi:hypothetical protein